MEKAGKKKRNVETTWLFLSYSVQLCLRFLILLAAVILYIKDPSLLDIRHPFSDPQKHIFAYVLFAFFLVDFATKLTTRSKIAMGSLKQYKSFHLPTPRTTGLSREELIDYIRTLIARDHEKSSRFHFHPKEAALARLREVQEQVRQGTADAVAATRRTLHDIDVLRLLPFADEDLDVSQDIRSQFRKRRLREIAGVLVFWIVFNAAVAMALYIFGVFDDAAFVVWSCGYFVFDMVCVVLWCPLQLLFMHNRCCTTCQIFNWDGIMAVTPLFFIPSWYSLVLIFIALIILFRWEIAAFVYPERFFEETNASLSCASCKDKLCRLREPILEPFAPTSKRPWEKSHETKQLK